MSNSLIQTQGSVSVQVRSNNLTSNIVTFNVTAAAPTAPQITGLNPTSAQANSGNFNLTITGSGFASGAQVLFGSTTLTPSSVSATSIVVAVSNSLIQTQGSISVTVRVNSVSSNAVTFTVTQPGTTAPQITGLNPTSVPANSGNFNLTLTGSGFASGAQVLFGSTTLTPSSISATSIVVAVSNSLIQTQGSISVTVRVNSVSSNAVTFTVTQPGTTAPQITGLNPTGAQANSGNFNLTITGSGFASGAQVLFGSTTLTPSSISATSIVVAVSNSLIQTQGSISVTVRVNSVSSNAVTFTVTQPGTTAPQITGLNPTSVPANSGNFNLTLTGSGFASGAQVLFGSTALTPSSLSASSIVVAVSNSLIQTQGSVSISVRVNNVSSNTVFLTVTSSSGGTISINVTVASVNTLATNVIATLSSSAPYPISGTITMDFANSVGLTTTYRDPAMGFASGGLSITFTIGQGQTQATFPNNGAVNFGAVAGVATLTISTLTGNGQNLLPSLSGPPAFPISVLSTSPVITANSVQIVNVSGGFNVVLQGYSTPRNMRNASFQFVLAANASPDTGTSFTVDVTNVFSTWFNSNTGLSNGSRFLLTVPFTTTADPNLVQSVTVTLVNSIGSSAPASGGH